MDKYGVKYYLDTEVTLDLVIRESPEVVILAAGSRPIIPSIPGADRSIICTLPDVLNGNESKICNTVVVGGGPTGCEVALYLAEKGSSVTMLELFPEIGNGLETVIKKMVINRLNENRVKIITGNKLVEVKDDGVVAEDENGKELFIEAERVVISIGNRPDARLYERIKSLGIPTHKIGDCLEVRSVKAAIREAALISREI